MNQMTNNIITEKMIQDIRQISEHYSRAGQIEKAKEELQELLEEYKSAVIPFGINDAVSLPGNYISETADVIIMILQIIMQHGDEENLIKEIEYKLERQFRRMENE